MKEKFEVTNTSLIYVRTPSLELAELENSLPQFNEVSFYLKHPQFSKIMELSKPLLWNKLKKLKENEQAEFLFTLQKYFIRSMSNCVTRDLFAGYSLVPIGAEEQIKFLKFGDWHVDFHSRQFETKSGSYYFNPTLSISRNSVGLFRSRQPDLPLTHETFLLDSKSISQLNKLLDRWKNKTFRVQNVSKYFGCSIDVAVAWMSDLENAQVILPELAEQADKYHGRLSDFNAKEVGSSFYNFDLNKCINSGAVSAKKLDHFVSVTGDIMSLLKVETNLNKLTSAELELIGQINYAEIPLLDFVLRYQSEIELKEFKSGASQRRELVAAEVYRLWQERGGNSLTLDSGDVEAICRKVSSKREHSSELPKYLTAFLQEDHTGKIWVRSYLPGTHHRAFSKISANNQKVFKFVCQSDEKKVKDESDVIYAQIDYLPSRDRRIYTESPIFFRHRICVNTPPQSENDLEVSDLFLSQSQGRLLLRSKRLNKQVVPVSTHLYSWMLDTNAIFRVLNILGDQRISGPFAWSWEKFAKLPFLPRVSVRNLVISPARWMLTPAELTELRKMDFAGGKKFFAKKGIPAEVLLVFGGGGQLYVNILRSEMWDFFKRSISTHLDFFIQESPWSFANENVRPTEYLLPMRNTDFYEPKLWSYHLLKDKRNLETGIKKNLAIEDGCLYFKIYLDETNLEFFLFDQLMPRLRNHFGPQLVKNWFYIRYRDPQFHIRLRLLEVGQQTNKVLTFLIKELKAAKKSGYIQFYEIGNYEREIERYGGKNGLKLFERHSCEESEWFSRTLSKIYSRYGRNQSEAMKLIAYHLTKVYFLESGLSEGESQKIFKHFEALPNRSLFWKDLASSKEFESRFGAELPEYMRGDFSQRKKSFKKVMHDFMRLQEQCKVGISRDQYWIFLFHMCLNRLSLKLGTDGERQLIYAAYAQSKKS